MMNNFVSQGKECKAKINILHMLIRHKAGQMQLHGLPNDILPNIDPITIILGTMPWPATSYCVPTCMRLPISGRSACICRQSTEWVSIFKIVANLCKYVIPVESTSAQHHLNFTRRRIQLSVFVSMHETH